MIDEEGIVQNLNSFVEILQLYILNKSINVVILFYLLLSQEL